MASVSEFAKQDFPRGYGSGDGSGYGDGDGYGGCYGSGYGDCYGSGDVDGYGSGYGDGYGSGDGSGYGSGDGDGYGSGDGSGYGDGDGYGGCYGLKSINGNAVYYIDDVPTVLISAHGNLAKGFTVDGDFQLTPCYVAKGQGYFAHGKTAQGAAAALSAKILENAPIEERISDFVAKFPKYKTKYPVREFYDWHHVLTGSCEFGRNQFMKNHNINMDDEKTVGEFIELTQNDYGGYVIQQLKEKYENGTDGRKVDYAD